MHYAYTEFAAARAVFNETCEPGFGLGDRHTVQVDLSLSAETAAREFSHGATADRCPAIAEVVSTVGLYGIGISQYAFAQHVLIIGSREPCLGLGFLAGASGTRLGTQWFCPRYRASEQVRIVIAHAVILRLWCGRDIEYSERVASRQT